MERPRIRPSFVISLKPGADEAMTLLRHRLKGAGQSDCARSKGRCADFFVEEDRRRLWSPYLSIQVEAREQGSLLRGRFGPHPELWTLFMFLYTAVGFLGIMGLMLGFVQWQSGLPAWGFWGFAGAVPGVGVLFAVSAAGQRLSAHQMKELKERVEALVEGLEAPEDPASGGGSAPSAPRGGPSGTRP